ncbi:MAG: hypothetical protein ACK4M7_05805, partial [Burkholderiales bacterium]
SAYANNITSLAQRDKVYWMFICFVMIVVFSYTLLGYLKYGVLIITFSICSMFYLVTLPMHLRVYRSAIGITFVLAFLTMHLEGAGQLYLAFNRLITLLFAAVIGWVAINLIPLTPYSWMFKKALLLYLQEVQRRLEALMYNQSYIADLVHEHVVKMKSSLGCLTKDNNYLIYTNCYNQFLKIGFGVIYLQSLGPQPETKRELMLQLQLIIGQVIALMQTNTPIAEEKLAKIAVILAQDKTAPEQQLWQDLSLALKSWNELCFIQQ